MEKALVINLIGGPGSGKSVMAAQLFVDLKKRTKYKIEYFQEYVKPLVWAAEDPNHRERAEDAIEELNNQRSISNKIYRLLKIMSGQLDIIIVDGPLFHGIHYNRANKDNTSDQDKTEKFIIEKFGEFDNCNILLSRGNIEYEREGRQQTYEEALYIDKQLEYYLKKYSVPYVIIKADSNNDYASLLKLIFERSPQK